ncbi:MAG: ZIP family metal transporter [Planctomycetales bacterium]|nr:ZIP family metal transporter [Planctomycetales bacterium]
MSPALLIALYCICIVASSLVGGLLPSLVRLTHTRLQLMMSGVGGLMLGIGLFHLLPHAVGSDVSLDRAIWWLMTGLLVTFFLMRIFHGHSHAVPPGDPPAAANSTCPAPEAHHHHHHHDHDAAERRGAAPGGSAGRSGKYRWVGIALGLSLHTALDGVALAASVLHDQQHAPAMAFAGLAVFVGVLLHKPLDSLSITSLMAAGGWHRRAQQMVNLGYALMCPVGAAIFLLGVAASPNQTVVVGCALAFSAGIFICLSLSDLLPELQFHSHDRLKLTAALLVGVILAYGMGYLEPAHVHHHPSAPHPAEPPSVPAHDRWGGDQASEDRAEDYRPEADDRPSVAP